MFELFDSHAHLTFKNFRSDLAAVLDEARAAGVTGIVTIGSGGGPQVFRDARELAGRHDWIWPTAGIHPHNAQDATPEVLAELAEAAAEPDVVAVGEMGLDYHYNYSPRAEQRAVFRAQLRMAQQLEKPIIIHTREADAETLELLRDEGIGLAGGVVHCFSGGPEFCEAMLELGLHISFSGIVTFKTAESVREAAAIVPDGSLLIETDSPFLAPPPKRGKRNTPANVAAVARTLAEVRGITFEDVARITTRNARELYGLGGGDDLAPIVYPIRDQLYVNASNECTLACVFCPKRRDWTVKGHMLRHAAEVPDEAVRSALWGADPTQYREVVFCGLGEPTTRYDLVVELGEALRAKGVQTRLDTDGLASLRQGRDVTAELARAFDAVSVSLNAADGETYRRICPSQYGERAWEAAAEFLRRARPLFGEVTASVVAVPGLDVESVRVLVEDEIGVEFRVRAYNVTG